MDAGPREAASDAQPGPAAAPPPVVAWAAHETRRTVPGAPDFEFAGAGVRLVAYFVDGLILGILTIVAAIVVTAALGTRSVEEGTGAAALNLVATAVGAAYFVGLWRSPAKATLGMRLFRLQVGNAFDGVTLTPGQAFGRWLALGYPVTLIAAVVPATTEALSLIALLWSFVLLISTGASATRQGLHDRFANSAVVVPAGASASSWVLGCILVVGVIAMIALVGIVSLISLGAQVQDILSNVGTSV